MAGLSILLEIEVLKENQPMREGRRKRGGGERKKKKKKRREEEEEEEEGEAEEKGELGQPQGQRSSCQSRISHRKPFLKCGEGIARLEQTKKKLFRKNRKQPSNQMTRQVSLGCQPHFCLPQSQDWGKHKQENHSVLEWQAKTRMITLGKEKETAFIPPREEAKEDTESSQSKENNQWLQERSDRLVKVASTLTPGVNWPDLMQQYHGQESESKSQTDGKNEPQFLDCQNHLDKREEPTDNQVQQHFDLLSPKTPVVPGNSGLQEVVQNREKQVDGSDESHNSPKVWFVPYHPNEKLVSSRSTPGHRTGASPEFKKVNDRILKNVHPLNKAIRKEKECMVLFDQKRKQKDKRRIVSLGNDELPSSDEKSSFSGSTTCYHLCPRSGDLPDVHHAYQDLDISEPDYASDKPSESEEMALRRPSKFFVKKRRSQKLLGQKHASSRANSSESSSETIELRGSRSLPSFQTSPDHHVVPTRPKKEPKAQSTTRSIQIPDVQPPACDLVASLFPILKDKVNSPEQEPCESIYKEAPKRPTGKLQELEEEIDKLHGENPLLSQVKAAEEKVMQFLRAQISHFKAEKGKEVNFSDEHWKEENPRTQLTKANLEKWTKSFRISRKDDDTKEMLILKQQINGLQEQFKINESRWSMAHIKLQNQIEVLMKQNLELQEELRASEHQRLDITKKSLALHSARRKSESLPVSNKIERKESKRATSKEHGEKTVSRSLRVRSPPSLGKRSALERRITSFDPEMVIHRSLENLQKAHSRKSPVPVSPLAMCNEESLAAYENDRSPLTSGNYEDALLKVQNNDHRSSVFRRNEDFQGYSSKSAASRKLLLSLKNKKNEEEIKKEIKHPDGKVEWKFSDGRKTISFPNGTKKEISTDKKTTIVTFPNGDVQKFMPDQRVLYYYADAQTTHTTYPDGLEVIQFPNKQIERHHPNGIKEVVFPDGTVKHLGVGHEETVFPDGTLVKVERNGDKTIIFSNGQKEIHTSQFKRREFPDGTIKTVYNTGRQETKYTSGRVRIKDETGKIILDKK
ncbi:centromere protein J-like [Petaurus breviceps papuanus]|uniref:centromere protein J-like n=1 Tax=Petaurus breviceps papuanus TaxID=3040969 RepID=UPI0036DF76EF